MPLELLFLMCHCLLGGNVCCFRSPRARKKLRRDGGGTCFRHVPEEGLCQQVAAHEKAREDHDCDRSNGCQNERHDGLCLPPCGAAISVFS